MQKVRVAEAPGHLPAGLSDEEAAARLRAEGPNELPQAERRTLLRIALEVAREPMFQLLVAAGLIYLVLGDLGEALMLLAFVAVTVSISIVQERRTEKVLDALRDLTSPRAQRHAGGRAPRRRRSSLRLLRQHDGARPRHRRGERDGSQ